MLAQGATDINGPHQGALVDTPGGESWFLHFQDAGAYGRVVHLQPVTWRDDWPVIGDDADGDGKGEPGREWRKPALRPARFAVPPTSDKFTVRRLGRQWQWQANPRHAWWSIQEEGLRLRAVPGQENLWAAPHLLLQKFPAPEFGVSTEIDVSRLRDGERAGLIVFGADYAWIGVERSGDKRAVTFRSLHDAATGVAEKELGRESLVGNAVALQVTVGAGAVCRFSFASGGRMTPMGPSFTARPGRWVGAKVGVFASAPAGRTKMGSVTVRSFSVSPGLR